MKETIERIIDDAGIVRDSPLGENLLQSLNKHLSKLNPNRIDEERIQKEWHIIYPNDSWENSWMKKIIEKYNSTATEPLPQKELPSVEDLLAEIYDLEWNRLTPDACKQLAQRLIDKYSLHSKKEEWCKVLKVGDQFKDRDGFVCKFNGNHHIEDMTKSIHYVNNCSPYTEPSIVDRLKAKGVTEEELAELRGSI